jgi:hypothetical protein
MQESAMFNRRVEESGHKFIQFVAGCVLAILVCYLLITAFLSVLNRTDVFYDAVVTDKCVAVVTAQGVVKPCEGNIPVRHNQEFVAPEITYDDVQKYFAR